MEPSVILARQFAQLLWLLRHEAGNVDEQKAALRLLLATSRQGEVSIAVHGGELQANGHPVPGSLTGVADLVAQMTGHSLALITTNASASPGDLLSAARIIAGEPVPDDGGAAVEAQRVTAGVNGVLFAARPRLSQDQPPPAVREPASMDFMEFGDVFDDPLAEARAHATPRSSQSIAAPFDSRSESRGLFAQFAATRIPTETYDALLRQLETSPDPGVIARALEDIAMLAEAAAREGKAAIASEILFRLGVREPELEHFESKRAFTMTLRRLARPEIMGVVARQLPHEHDNREQIVAVLTRAGEEGADALIEQIVAVEHQRDRRVYFDALVRLKAGVPALLHMLSDTRWFVARNAADLLGEMQVAEAEPQLSELLKHEDERVRRSATAALMRLGTPRALVAIQHALTDPLPQTRMQAAAALVTRKDVRTSVPQLLRALDVEKDEEVQASFLMALGRMGTAEAVQRLANAAEGKRGLFHKTPTLHRIAAVNALAEARTEQALEALRGMQSDKEADVRAAVTLALGRVARTTSH